MDPIISPTVVDDESSATNERHGGPTVTRRGFLQSTVAAAGAAGIPVVGRAQAPAPTPTPMIAPSAGPRPVTLSVNGRDVTLQLEPRVTLLDALREYIGLTGTKKGCDRGQCGACTVMVDGRRVNACLTLAVMNEGRQVTTVEGLASGDRLAPLQAAFIEYDAFQCGFCTPGQLCSATAAIRELRDGRVSAATPDVRVARVAFSDAELRERMSGNLCRCGAYPNILKAMRSVASDAATAMSGFARDVAEPGPLAQPAPTDPTASAASGTPVSA